MTYLWDPQPAGALAEAPQASRPAGVPGRGGQSSLWPAIERLAGGRRLILLAGGAEVASAAGPLSRAAYALASGAAAACGSAVMLRIGTQHGAPPGGDAPVALADGFVAGLSHRQLYPAEFAGLLAAAPPGVAHIAALEDAGAQAVLTLAGAGAGLVLVNAPGQTPARLLHGWAQAAAAAATPLLAVLQAPP